MEHFIGVTFGFLFGGGLGIYFTNAWHKKRAKSEAAKGAAGSSSSGTSKEKKRTE